MPNKMLIDASHPEETRVVVTRGSRIEEFDFESQDKKQLRGNIYLARVTRVEPSLQAAFVEYGGNRHGFLAFSEIHPDYYQIPVADRQALLKAEAEEAKAADDEAEQHETSNGNGRKRRRSRTRGGNGEAPDDASPTQEAQAAKADGEAVSQDVASSSTNGDENGRSDEDGEVDTVGAEDALDEVHNRRKPVRRNYKIQEVIKRRQILLVQVVKEERGSKGAALTTYLSLAGRYSVLMPNTARGGGISRKITNPQDRKRLKEVVKGLDVPEGMGVILRTAGANRTKAEIKRDYEYLMRLWERVRNFTLESIAPALVYEEGSLIKRSVRDLYNKEIDQILVAGEEGYREAKDFMRMLMPSHAKVVQPYRDTTPIFARNGIEAQLDKMLQPQVTLKSGGYIIINQTEALVAIDVNSGRSTKEHSIEDTALQTNLEAADEVARQLRLRDLAGLIVIDFIDMEENRNNRAVEKRLKECLKSDRARIQVGRISHFGLMEMSRQRIRASVLESTMQPCPHCGGTGHIRSESSVALLVVRAIEEYLIKDSRNDIVVRTPASTALYLLNQKRSNLIELEERFGTAITVETDEELGGQHYAIVKGAPSSRAPLVPPAVQTEIAEDVDEPADEDATDQAETEESNGDDGGSQGRKRRRKRRRRGGRDRTEQAAETGSEEKTESAPVEEETATEHAAADEGERKKRHRGKRGGRRNRQQEEPVASDEKVSANDAGQNAADEVNPQAEAAASDNEPSAPSEAAEGAVSEAVNTPAQDGEKPATKPRRRSRSAKGAQQSAAEEKAASEVSVPSEPAAPSEDVSAGPEPVGDGEKEAAAAEKKPRGRRRKIEEDDDAAKEPVVSSPASEQEEAPRKTGWWQRRSFF